MSEPRTVAAADSLSPLRSGENVYVTLTPRAASGRLALADPAALASHAFAEFLPPEGRVDSLAEAYRRAGCEVAASSRVGLTLRLPAALATDLFGTAIRPVRNRYIREFERFAYRADRPLDVRLMAHAVEAATLPAASFELDAPVPAAEAPLLGFHHLRVPEDIERVAGLAGARRRGLDGRGVHVVMVDTGFHRHPFYHRRGIDAEVVAAVPDFDPRRDERGHGTAMTSVLTSVAPGIRLSAVKMSDEGFGFPAASLQAASRLGADIVNCSWGVIGNDPQVHLEAANLIDLGALLVFAAGNGSDDRPDAMFQTLAPPGACLVGGCFVDAEGRLSPAEIASSYRSWVYPGRSVPDVCGPCGNLPAGYLIVFPTEPGSQFDRRNGRGDGTRQDDGWLVSSGTSAAAAFASGVAALALQHSPGLPARALRRALQAGCVTPPALAEAGRERVGSGFLQADGVLAALDGLGGPKADESTEEGSAWPMW